MLVGATLGAAVTLAALTWARGSGEGISVAHVRPRCGVSVVLFEPDGPESRIIDAATGGHGFSHVTIDGCEADERGRPLLIDCRPGLGVARLPAADYDGRPRVRVWLPLCEGRELYGCAQGRIGQPYNALEVVMPNSGPVGGVICSQLVYECLPVSLRARVPRWPEGRPVAPNDIARGFGAKPGANDITLEGRTT
ncbi:MAG: hypothetical protein K0V04_30910 [Deltaproteobacteria bacterium]|nr:hypothetical protein [Deltaproteobacteria bacterium]